VSAIDWRFASSAMAAVFEVALSTPLSPSATLVYTWRCGEIWYEQKIIPHFARAYVKNSGNLISV